MVRTPTGCAKAPPMWRVDFLRGVAVAGQPPQAQAAVLPGAGRS